MKFEKDQTVIVIDTMQKPAGSGVILSYNAFTRYYKIRLSYFNSGKQEEIEVPEQRILRNTGVIDAAVK